MDPKTIVTWITIVSAIATGASFYTSLKERSDIHISEIADLTARVATLERDRALLERVHAIELRLATMEAEAGKEPQRKGNR